jgi:hypothetical protein
VGSDDAGRETLAPEYRRRAAERFERFREQGVPVSYQPGFIDAILTDLYRRAKNWDAAAAAAQRGLVTRADALIGKVLRFELHMIAGHDSRCYTVDDVERASLS